jgi:hypothetical protein
MYYYLYLQMSTQFYTYMRSHKYIRRHISACMYMKKDFLNLIPFYSIFIMFCYNRIFYYLYVDSLIMPLAGLHFYVGLDSVTPSL